MLKPITSHQAGLEHTAGTLCTMPAIGPQDTDEGYLKHTSLELLLYAINYGCFVVHATFAASIVL